MRTEHPHDKNDNVDVDVYMGAAAEEIQHAFRAVWPRGGHVAVVRVRRQADMCSGRTCTTCVHVVMCSGGGDTWLKRVAVRWACA